MAQIKYQKTEYLKSKKLLGLSINMCLNCNKTAELWKSFMIERKKIKKIVHPNLYSIQIYNQSINIKDFTPETKFTKWAAIEAFNEKNSSNKWKAFDLSGGLYAVFLYKGLASDFQRSFQYIFNEWLPKSEYEIDNRPHFEILGEKYKNDSPDSEEEIWIPIRQKE